MILDSKIFNPQAKVLIHNNKIQKFFKTGNVDPITIEVDPSNACNHSCPFCISGHIHLSKFKGTKFFDRRMMKKEVLTSLVQDIVKMDIQSLSWTGGGEPTQNPHLKEAINFIKKNSNIEMGMFTNGTLLKRFDLFDTLVDSLSWVRVSIDAGKAKTYDELRVTNDKNNFDVMLNNVKKLIQVKKEKNSNIYIGVGFVVTKDNFNEVVDFAKLFKNIDVNYCQFKPEIIQVERNGELDKAKEQIGSDFWITKVATELDKAKEILGKKFECNSYKLEDLIKSPKDYGRNYKQCLGSQFQPCVGADGHVYVCTNHRGHKEYSYGNIEDKSFKDIWSDMEKRSCIMNKINNTEKFKNCSQLCKPHESNKILWTMKENQNDEAFNNEMKLKSKQLKGKILHHNFI
jgi:cyclic pyranopterin phosphate synthase